MNREEIDQGLEWRYAVKQFDGTRKVSAPDWAVLENSLLLSPSSYGLQPWKFLVVQNSDLRQKLRAVSWNQSQVTDCSHYVIFLNKRHIDEVHIRDYMKRIAEVRAIPVSALEGFAKAIIDDVVVGPRAKVVGPWIDRQSYIAMGFLMETAAMLKIDTCPMEGFDSLAYDNLLGLTDTEFKSIASVAIGYRSADDKSQSAKKVRFPIEKIIEYRL